MITWIKKHPITITTGAAVIALLFNGYALIQNSKTLETTNKSLLLSFNPSLELNFRVDSILIRNTSLTAASDIRIYPISYTIESEPFKVLSRIGAGYYNGDNKPIADRLEGGKSILIRPQQLLLALPLSKPIGNDTNDYKVAVITFRREIDSKKFALIEIFIAATIDRDTVFFPLYTNGMSGPPERLVHIKNEILNTEKAFFNAEVFQ